MDGRRLAVLAATPPGCGFNFVPGTSFLVMRGPGYCTRCAQPGYICHQRASLRYLFCPAHAHVLSAGAVRTHVNLELRALLEGWVAAQPHHSLRDKSASCIFALLRLADYRAGIPLFIVAEAGCSSTFSNRQCGSGSTVQSMGMGRCTIAAYQGRTSREPGLGAQTRF